jgi:NAD(P)-dependent dehydrogenase (short-subunit alcohol dehydrogenase family)
MITGARGIGLGMLQHLAADGCDLAINGTREEADVADVLTELRRTGRDVIYCQGDVGSTADRARIVELVRTRFGRLHVLINNAGITSPGRKDLLDAEEAGFDRVMDVNLKGPFFLTQLRRVGWSSSNRQPSLRGVIINVSSVSAEIISLNRGDYCLTKSATGMATKLWAARLARHRIDVYEIQPGVIRSDMTAPVTEKYDRLIGEGLTLERRWGEPDDVGRAAAMLVRGDLPYATGQVLKIDGGMTIRQM